MMKKTIAGAGAAAAALVASVALATPASAAADTCSSGTHYEGNSLGTLTNGVLYGGWCTLNGSGTDIRRVNVGYNMTSGSGVQVVFGWERINCNATANGGSYWGSVINISPGQTKEVAFTYGGGVVANSTYPCVRSKMKDDISGQFYWGKILRLYG